MLKALKKLEIEALCLNIIKAICDKPTANIILTGGKLKALPVKSGIKQRFSTLSTLIPYSAWIPSHTVTQKKEIKGIQIGKEEVKVYLFVGNIILYLKDPKYFT
jgi:hypothetical protein